MFTVSHFLHLTSTHKAGVVLTRAKSAPQRLQRKFASVGRSATFIVYLLVRHTMAVGVVAVAAAVEHQGYLAASRVGNRTIPPGSC